MTEEKCYMCERHASSVEHVPPRCLFPEKKEAGRDFRSNLITVPSCQDHNERKSGDDEFLMISLAGILGNNSIGYQHYTGKVQRTLKRSSFRFLEKVFLKRKTIRLEDDNRFMEVLVGTPDYERLTNCFRHIAFGIYRYAYKKRFLGEVNPFLSFLHPTEANAKTFKALIKARIAVELDQKPKCGENQEIFWYQFTEPDRFGIFLVRLCFYQNVEIYVAYRSETADQPYDLGMDLVDKGMKTVITLNGKEYIFN